MTAPTVRVGIVSAESLEISLGKGYTLDGEPVRGAVRLNVNAGKVVFAGRTYDKLYFAADDAVNDTFEVKDVVIGVDFHWERKETQVFNGSAEIIVENGRLTLINIVPVEEYLKSVISSEMSSHACLEFLKAHAVISRSWLLAQLVKKNGRASSCIRTDAEITKWYDRDDHVNFDVCADDHCQRYQGRTRVATETAVKAVEETSGQVLLDNEGALCDTRFSKCCGGVFEEFENCWEPVHHHYLEARADSPEHAHFPDLSIEENARRWIMERPAAFCNTDAREVLEQVLNNYDQETTDFYRWTVRYTADELSELVSRRSGIDFGTIESLEALSRGTSGRITRLKITGSKCSFIVGKELEIRKWLSTSHLYSSAFIVEREGTDFVLHGAGWGHGVGLCQIGAAVMGTRGYSYQAILDHYFPGARLTKQY